MPPNRKELFQFMIKFITPSITIGSHEKNCAIASFVLWWGREHCAFSNVLIALGFSQAFEVVSLLANRYSIVDV